VGVACVAGASFVTNPLDLAKLRLQVQRGRAAAAVNATTGGVAAGAPAAATTAASPLPHFQYRNLPHALRRIVAEEGWQALMRGAGARMAFHAPSTAITMTLFEYCKRWWLQRLGG
jgi:hypothetical protein